MNIDKTELDNIASKLASECKTQEALFGDEGIMRELLRKTLQAALDGEITEHLGYEKHKKSNQPNSRNGYGKKSLTTEQGELEIAVPRDRDGSFEPKIVEKRQNRVAKIDKKIIAFYARGLSVTDIKEELHELYGVDVSESLISNVTNSIMDEVISWQNRPLDKVYPIVYLDCIVVKVRENKQIINKSVYLALGVNMSGHKELLGMWINTSEGSKFWLAVLTELKNRGLTDILIACVDGLTGFADAINAVYPQTKVQLCVVHLIRNSVKYVSWKDRKLVCGDLRKIYTSATADSAMQELDCFASKWDGKYPGISHIWVNNWERVTPFFDYPQDIRKVIYTTNAIESLNMTLRKVIKNKRVFPTDESVFKLLYLAINNISKKWSMPIRDWHSALNRFTIEFGDRVAA